MRRVFVWGKHLLKEFKMHFFCSHGSDHHVLILLKRGAFLHCPVKMGSSESRCLPWACLDKQEQTITDKQGEDETKAFLKKWSVSSEETLAVGRSPHLRPVSKPILDFAQKMSEDVISQALMLCWEVEINYKELPFIDIECEYVI